MAVFGDMKTDKTTAQCSIAAVAGYPSASPLRPRTLCRFGSVGNPMRDAVRMRGTESTCIVLLVFHRAWTLNERLTEMNFAMTPAGLDGMS